MLSSKRSSAYNARPSSRCAGPASASTCTNACAVSAAVSYSPASKRLRAAASELPAPSQHPDWRARREAHPHAPRTARSPRHSLRPRAYRPAAPSRAQADAVPGRRHAQQLPPRWSSPRACPLPPSPTAPLPPLNRLQRAPPPVSRPAARTPPLAVPLPARSDSPSPGCRLPSANCESPREYGSRTHRPQVPDRGLPLPDAPECADAPRPSARATTGVTVTKSKMDAIALVPDEFHGDWNYKLVPR